MSKLSCFINRMALYAIAIGSLGSFSNRARAENAIEVACDNQTGIPTITATLSNPQDTSDKERRTTQTTNILSFLPEYFTLEEASLNCQKTATSLQGYYNRGEMNYLASDTIDGKPVVCAVERRGISCNGYSSEILFALNKPVNPTQLLYDMLGGHFKDTQAPASRTVSRIYTDLRPTWWPF